MSELETEIPMGIVVSKCTHDGFEWCNVPVDYLIEQGVPQATVDAAIAADEQEVTNGQSREYLASTDWMATREAETGTAMPADVKAKRAEARTAIV